MGNDIALSTDRTSLPEPFGPVRAEGMHWTERPDGSDGFTFERIITVFREHWKVVFASVIAGAALAILATLMTTPLYRAKVVLEVNPPAVEILDEERGSSGSMVALWDLIATQVGLLKSISLGERVAEDLNLASNPNFIDQSGDAASRLKAAGAKVAAGVEAELPKDGQLIEFTYTSDDPQMAAQIANGIADSFIDSSLQRRYDASNYAREFLQRQINKTRGDLERSEKALVAYAQSQGIINTATGEAAANSDANSLQGASLVALNQALAEATAKRIAAEGAYRQAKLAGGSAEATASTSGLRSSLAALESEYSEKRTLMKPEHPDMVALKSRIDELNRQISNEQSRVAGGQATSLLAAYRGAVAAENALRGRVNQLRGSVLDLRGRSIQYNILQRDVDTNRSLYDALLQRYKEVGVAGGLGNSPVSIVDRATVPGAPFKPNPLFNLLGGMALGLLAGMGVAFALDLLNDVIKTREDVRTRLGLSCLGVVPKRMGTGSIVNDLDDGSSSVAEAYSAILASLRFATDHGAPRTLLLTSTAPAEGKSSSAFAIAQNYARRGERILLVDADLRRPVFKTANAQRGLTKLLTNEDALGMHVHETQFENLFLLPCGPIPPNPADLLSTPRFAGLMREAARDFDRVIIDGPPMLGLADAALLTTAAENVVMVIESGRTRTKAARVAIERIRNSGGHLLGAILTKSTEEASSYGYRYRYGSVEDQRENLIMISSQSET